MERTAALELLAGLFKLYPAPDNFRDIGSPQIWHAALDVSSENDDSC